MEDVIERVWHKKESILNLSHRCITVVPADIARLTFIRILLLNNNNILMPPEEITHLNQLESLSLEHNQLTLLPSGIALLSSTLLFLNLSYNPLLYLSPSVGQLVNLQDLWLSHIGISSFPDHICSLCMLTHLSLEGNSISSIPSGTPIGNFKALRWFSLAKNKLNSRSAGGLFCSLPCLQVLNLSDNLLTEVPEISLYPSLSALDLRGNKLLSFPKDDGIRGLIKVDVPV